MVNYKRYKRNPVLDYPQREWPNKEIEKANESTKNLNEIPIQIDENFECSEDEGFKYKLKYDSEDNSSEEIENDKIINELFIYW